MALQTNPTAKPAAPGAKGGNRPRNFRENDFPFIRKASITLACCVLAGAMLVGASGYMLNLQMQAKSQAQAKNNEAREKLRQTEMELKEIHEYQPKYRQLLARGFVGEERRLNWIEGIKTIQERHKLLPITYEIFPQRPFQLADSVQLSELELRGSKMQITMALLHEGDLISLLRELKATEPNVPVDCLIKQMPSMPLSTTDPRLIADCTLYWITLAPRAAEGQNAQPAGQ